MSESAGRSKQQWIVLLRAANIGQAFANSKSKTTTSLSH